MSRTIAARRPWLRTGLRRERWHGLLFVAPALAYLALVVALPLADALWTSLLRIRGLNARFVGLANYARALDDPAVWHAVRLSLGFTLICVALHMTAGLALALLVRGSGRLGGVLRLAFLLPWMIAPAIGATLWLWLFDAQFGVLNYLLGALGLIGAPVVWLGRPGTAFAAVVVAEAWREIPFAMLLLLAGLLGVPPEQYEAAALDGATAWQRFRHVTLPNLRALLIVVSTLDAINTVRQFDVVAVMTGGGPVSGTEMLPMLIYNTGFRANDLGGAAAIGVLLLVVVLAASALYGGLLRAGRVDGAA